MTAPATTGVLAEIRRIYRASRKERDIFWNVYVARPVAAALVMALARTPLTPNQVTFLGLFIFGGAAGLIAGLDGWTGLLWGALVLELSYVLDCADGQLARLKDMTSKVGAYLDFFVDEVKALLLVSACAVRLWSQQQDDTYLLVGLMGVLLVATGTSLTTFIRRPEYAGEELRPGVPRVDAAPGGGPVPWLMWLIGRFLRWIVHYPSWFVYVALTDGLEQVNGALLFLGLYLGAYLLYVGRTSLAVLMKLGGAGFYPDSSEARRDPP